MRCLSCRPGLVAAVDVEAHVMQDLRPPLARAEGERQILDILGITIPWREQER